MNDLEDVCKSLTLFHEPALQSEMSRHGKLIAANKGDILIKEGQRLDFLPIVIKGSIRVYQQSEDREILLYYVGPQQTCMMSLSSAYFNNISAANGMAMEPTEILILPANLIAEWQLKYASWNRFIIQTFRNRYDELLTSFGSVAFNPMPARLKEYLLKRARSEGTKKINISHQTLANELATTRVVISRILKQFEREGMIKQFRGSIQLT
jgi:CRP/FNR family transcriptional regulator, anaerobic regulatory protein